MTNLRTAAQQALEALECANGFLARIMGDDPGHYEWLNDDITALRAALAEPVQASLGVPRAWLQEYDPARPALTPRLTLDSGRAAAWAAEGGRVLTLYAEAAPPSAPPRARRLTDEVIAELWHKNAGYHHHFARAVERWLNAE